MTLTGGSRRHIPRGKKGRENPTAGHAFRLTASTPPSGCRCGLSPRTVPPRPLQPAAARGLRIRLHLRVDADGSPRQGQVPAWCQCHSILIGLNWFQICFVECLSVAPSFSVQSAASDCQSWCPKSAIALRARLFGLGGISLQCVCIYFRTPQICSWCIHPRIFL